MTVRAPAPATFYIHDDLTLAVRAEHGPGSPADRLARDLVRRVQRQAHVHVLTEEQQIAWVLARGPQAPFATAVGVGRAGEHVAHRLHACTGWFPRIQRIDLAREETGDGGYRLVSASPDPLERQLAGLGLGGRVAIVDDTIFSGFTMLALLEALPGEVLARSHVFCLRCVAESLPAISARCPVTAGLAAPGRLLEDVSLINASGLVCRGAIRRAGQPSLAFFERPEWMRAWFPDDHHAVTALCRELNALLEPAASRG